MPTTRFLRFALVSSMLALAACGFQMRGIADLSFENLYIQGKKLTIQKELKKSLAVNGVKVVDNDERADLIMEVLSEATEKRILSLSGRGVVREFDLYYRVSFRLKDAGSETWGEPQFIENRRDFSYNDSELLAKQGEELRLYDDMRADAVREIMRRLVVQKPSKKAANPDK